MGFLAIPSTVPQWHQLAIYAIGIALIIMLLSRLPFVGRIIRFAISLGLFAFLIFILLQQAPYQPELSRLTSSLGLDDQKDRKSTRLNSSHPSISYAVFCLKKKKTPARL